MGRGRAKAKQQKVARELKYSTHDTDFSALQRELGHTKPGGQPEHDPYVDEGYEDDERWVSGSR